MKVSFHGGRKEWMELERKSRDYRGECKESLFSFLLVGRVAPLSERFANEGNGERGIRWTWLEIGALQRKAGKFSFSLSTSDPSIAFQKHLCMSYPIMRRSKGIVISLQMMGYIKAAE